MTLVPTYSATLFESESGLRTEVLSLPAETITRIFPWLDSPESWHSQVRMFADAPLKRLPDILRVLEFHPLYVAETPDKTMLLLEGMSSLFDLDDWERGEVVLDQRDPRLIQWAAELTHSPLLPVVSSPLGGRSIAELFGGGAVVVVGLIAHEPVLLVAGLFGIIFLKPLTGAAQGVSEGLREALREIVYERLIEANRRRRKTK
jgi:hypothetical protein